MAAIFKVDWIFDTVQGLGAGWTETFYYAAGTAAAALEFAQNGQYRQSRIMLLQADFGQPMIRVSDVAIRGDSLIAQVEPGGIIGQYPQPGRGADQSEQPWDGLLNRLLTTNQKRRMFIMRGLPVNVISNTYSYAPEANWGPLYDVWKAAAIAAPLLIRTQVTSLAGPPPVTFLPVHPQSIGITGDQRSLALSFTAGQATQLTPGAFFLLSGVSEATPVNKRWRVKAMLPAQPPGQPLDLVITSPGRRLLFGSPDATHAVVQPFAFDYLPILTIDPLRGARRATGRPFSPLRGRRPVRVS
jgi:hypothetical protein